MFERGPSDAAKCLADPAGYLAAARASPDMATKETLERVLSILSPETRPITYDDCLAFAARKYATYFSHTIEQLVTTFPEDAVTSTGTPFWTPPKRFPHVCPLDPNCVVTAELIRGMANLKATVHGIVIPAEAAKDGDATAIALRAAQVRARMWCGVGVGVGVG